MWLHDPISNISERADAWLRLSGSTSSLLSHSVVYTRVNVLLPFGDSHLPPKMPPVLSEFAHKRKYYQPKHRARGGGIQPVPQPDTRRGDIPDPRAHPLRVCGQHPNCARARIAKTRRTFHICHERFARRVVVDIVE